MLPEKYITVLRALLVEGPTTADEFVRDRGWYINSWAPVFTHLRQYGLAARTGEKRKTRWGAEAYVIAITDHGRDLLVTATHGS